MSREIDERVAKLEFDNKQFEKHAQESLATLEKLKGALDFKEAAKGLTGLEEAAKHLSALDKIADSIDGIAQRTSVMGSVVKRVWENITDDVYKFGKSMIDAVNAPLNQIKSGGYNRAMGIANAKFQIEGLKADWEALQEDINYGVKDTAYGFDAAAKAAAQLVASSVEAGESMQTALRAISGVAAMTNSTYEDISSIFTTVAGNGKLMTQQLRQLSYRGMNAAAELGKQLNKTEAEINDMVSKGEIDFATFAKAMDDAFGEHAKKANETFTGALSNVKAALSRTGEAFASPWLKEARDVLASMIPVLNGMNNEMKEVGIVKTYQRVLHGAAQMIAQMIKSDSTINAIKNAIHGVNNVIEFLLSLMNPLIRGFRSVFPTDFHNTLLKITESFKEFTEKLVLSEDQLNKIQWIFMGFFDVLSIIKNVVGEVLYIFGRLVGTLTNTEGGFLDLAAAVGKIINELEYYVRLAITTINFTLDYFNVFENLGKLWSSVFNGVKNLVTGAFNAVQDFVKRVADALGIAFDPVSSIGEAFWGIAMLIAKALDNFVIPAVKIAGFLIKSFIKLAAEGIIKVAKAIGTLRKGLSPLQFIIVTIRNIALEAFSKIFDVVGQVATIVGGALYIAFNKIAEVLKNIKADEVMNALSEAFTKGFAKIQVLGKAVVETMKKVKDALVIKIKSVDYSKIISNLLNKLNKLKTAISNVIKSVKVNGIKVTVLNLLSALSAKLADAKARIKEFVAALPKSDVLGFFKGIGASIAGLGSTIASSVKSFDLLGKAAQVASNVFEVFKGVAEQLIGYLIPITDKLFGVKEVFAGTTDSLNQTEQSVSIIERLGEAFKFLAEQITPARVAMALFVGVTIAIIKTVMDFTNSITYTISSVGGFMESLSGLVDQAKKSLGEVTETFLELQKPKTSVMEFAQAILIVAGSLYLLSRIPAKDLAISLGSLILAMGAFYGFLALTNKLNIQQAAIDAAKAMLPLSLALLALAGSLKILESITEMEGLVGKAAALGIIIMSLGVAMGFISKMAPQMSKGSFGVLVFAMSVMKITEALLQLSDIDTGAIYISLVNMVPIIGMVGLLSIAISKMGIVSSAGLVLALTGLTIAIPLFKKLSKIDYSTLLSALGKYLLAASLIGVVLGVITRIGGMYLAATMRAFSTLLLSMGGSVLLLTIAVKAINKLSKADITKAKDTIGEFMLMFIAFEALSSLTHFGNFKGLGSTFMSMAAAVNMLIIAVYILGTIDKSVLKKGEAAIAGIAAILAGFSVISGLAKNAIDFKVIISAVAGIILLSADLMILGSLPWKTIGKGIVAMGSVATILSITVLAMSKLSGNASLKTIPILITVTGALVALGAVMYKLCERDWKSIAAAGVGMGLAVAAMAAVLAAMSLIGSSISLSGMAGSIVELAAVTVALYFVGDAIGKLAALNYDGMLEAAASISMVLTAMGVVMDLSVIAGANAEAAAAGLLILIAFAATVWAALEIIGELNDLLDGGLARGMESAGEVFGSFLAGFKAAESSRAAEVGQNLSDFATNASTFFDVVNESVGSGTTKNIETFGEAFQALQSAMSIQNIENYTGPQVDAMLEQMTIFADGFPKVIEAAGNIEEGDVEKINNMAKCIAALAKAAQEIEGVGPSLKTSIFGDNSIAKFATGLTAVIAPIQNMLYGGLGPDGTGLLNTGIAAMNKDQLKGIMNVAEIIRAMADAASLIPREGGVFDIFIGPQDLEKFADMISGSVESIEKLINSVQGNKSLMAAAETGTLTGVHKIADIIKSLGEAAQAIPSEDVFSRAGVIDTSFEAFISGLVGQMDNIKKLVEKTNDLGDVAVLTKVSYALHELSTVAANETNHQSMNDFGTAMTNFGIGYEGMAKRLEQYKDAGSDFGSFVNRTISALQQFTSEDFSAFDNFLDKMNTTLSNGSKNVAVAVDKTIGDAVKAVGDKAEKFVSKGGLCLSNFAKGLHDGDAKGVLTSAVNSMTNHIVNEIRSKYSDFNEAGVYLVEGLAQGIRNKTSAAVTAATALGNATTAAFEAACQIESPSKVMEADGEYLLKGLVKGMEDRNELRKVEESSKDVALAMSEAFEANAEFDTSSMLDRAGTLTLKSVGKTLKSSVKTVKNAGKELGNAIGSNDYVQKGVTKAKKTYNTFTKELEKKTKEVQKNVADQRDTWLQHASDVNTGATATSVSSGTASAITDGVSDGLKKSSGATSSAASSAGSSTGESYAKSMQKAITKFSKTFKFKLFDYDPYKSSFLDEKKIKGVGKQLEVSLKYFASSFKNKDLRRAMSNFGDDFVKELKKSIEKQAKNKGIVSKKTIRELVQNKITEIEYAYSHLDNAIEKLSKKSKKTLLSLPEAVITYIKAYKSSSSYLSGAVKSFNSQFGSDISGSTGSKAIKQEIQNEKNLLKTLKSKKSTLESNIKTTEKTIKSRQKAGKSTEKQEKKLKTYEARLKSVNKLIKTTKSSITSLQNTNKNTAAKALDSFADQLYLSSDSYKTTKKNLEKAEKEYNKYTKKAKASKKELDKATKAGNKEAIEKYTKELDNHTKQAKTASKNVNKYAKEMAKGPANALKEWRNNVKKVYDDYLKLSNIKLADDLFTGLNFESTAKKADVFSDAMSSSLKSVVNSASSASRSVETAFDVFNASMDTGLNLLDKYQRSGRLKASTLLKRAEKQLNGYKEFQEGIEKMRTMGFSETLIERLEAEGTSSMKYIKGFVKMSSDEIAKYNGFVEEQAQIEQKNLEANIQKEKKQYDTWVDLVGQVAKRLGEDIPENMRNGFIDKLKERGVDSTNIIQALLGLDDTSFKSVIETFLYSASDTATSFAKTTAEKTSEKVFDSAYDALTDAYKKDQGYEEKLAKLAEKGFSDKVIDAFREKGREAGEAWVDSLLEEVDSTRIEEINKIIGGSSEQTMGNATENLKAENDAYDQYVKNRKVIEARIEKYNKNAKTVSWLDPGSQLEKQGKLYGGWDTAAKKLSTVYERITELGYSAADGVKVVANATVSEINAMYDELERRDKNNADNRWNQIKQEESTRAENVKKNQELMGKMAKLDSWVSPEARKTIMTQVQAMGVEDGNAWMESFLYASTSDKEGFKQFQTDFMNSVNATGSQADSVTASFAEIATNAVNTFSETAEKAANEKKETITKAISKASKLTDKQKKSLKKSYETTTEENLQAIVDVVNKSTTAKNTKKAFSNIANKCMTNVTDVLNKANGKTVGKNICAGIKTGIENNISQVTNAASKIGKDSIKALKKALGINSPSREGMQIGMYIDMGIANGLTEYQTLIDSSSEELKNDISEAIAGAIDVIDDLLDKDYNFEPTVTPVVDLDNLGVLEDAQAALNANIVPTIDVVAINNKLADLDAMLKTVGNIDITIGKESNKDVVDAIGEMRNDFGEQFTQLSDAVNNMQIIMDSGTLVGEIVQPMDRALGQRIRYQQRGM